MNCFIDQSQNQIDVVLKFVRKIFALNSVETE